MKIVDKIVRRVAEQFYKVGREPLEVKEIERGYAPDPASDTLVDLAKKALEAAHERGGDSEFHLIKSAINRHDLFNKEQYKELTAVISKLEREQQRAKAQVLFTQVVCGVVDKKEDVDVERATEYVKAMQKFQAEFIGNLDPKQREWAIQGAQSLEDYVNQGFQTAQQNSAQSLKYKTKNRYDLGSFNKL
jgi:hypothetical protein